MTYLDRLEDVMAAQVGIYELHTLWGELQDGWAEIERLCKEQGYDIFKTWRDTTGVFISFRTHLYQLECQCDSKAIKDVVDVDLTTIRTKDAAYGGSWKKRGGIGAFMMLARKMDRMVVLMQGYTDVLNRWRAAGAEGSEGFKDTIRDLRCYMVLVEAEIRVLLAESERRFEKI